MWRLFRPTALQVRQLFMVVIFPCLVQTHAAVAGDIFLVDDRDLHSRAIAAVPSVALENPLSKPGDPSPNLQLRNSLIIATGGTLVAVYGSYNWWKSGFDGNFETTNEDWFGAGTQFGGADKLGHLYSNYAGIRLLTPLFESAGNSRDASVMLSAWSTLGIYTAVEIVDGFSRSWKFSPQDAIANATGTVLGVLLETHPELDAIIDFRLDYRRSPRSVDFDPFGDYSAQKYLFVVKADGFTTLRDNSLLRYFEVALGYGTRGYDSVGVHQRDTYVGLSINLARLLADGVYDGRMHVTRFQRGTDRMFELVQFPSIAYARRSMN